MSSTYETGHAVNEKNFFKLKAITLSFGPRYAPSNPLIQQPALETLYTNGKAANDAVSMPLARWKTDVRQRQIIMKPLSRFITRVTKALKSGGASEEVISQADEFAKKIKGSRIGRIAEPKPENPSNNVSASQFSVTQRITNFRSLIEVLSTVPGYDPGATDLKLPALQTLLTDMEATNEAVLTAEVLLSTARKQRNKVLYEDTVGLVDVAQTVKDEVASIFGYGSTEHKQVTKIRFSKVR